ncbi:MAG: hypothetical protein A2722_03520 [Candidatus Doudnabacteria bacterium RIFCSPHIGHO2_01_FULL_50_11]|uniref:Uncharacterized protein n=1 Tax=Candidatus Doudnabacteria bacterium RIFCSPHIGHO2_01_FULL_50_11 TaxID=1817828 RepID=A0A1F5PIM0_9BACT|nr:MAG: hypothetical protein A2722_03520 [Candidatus Doudnabacteria bacterium RIFCSPHIGHO2_01_FULL_50_11]HLC44393.1 hypothetical protein [Patescibacteria group bacterium]
MPTIRIDYDDKKLEDSEILLLSNSIQKIVSSITGIEDTFVYANSPRIKVRVAPIEIFVQISATKVPDGESLFNDIKNQLSKWKKNNNFNHPINLTLMPMDWKFETDIK